MLFGTRLPKVARSLGQGISEFKKGINEPIEPEAPKAPKAPDESEKPAASKTEKAEETKDS